MYLLVLIASVAAVNTRGFTKENCEQSWSRYGHHCYRFFPLTATFASAERACSRRSATLLSLWLEEEKDFVLEKLWKFVSRSNFVWLGLVATENNTWSWLDASLADDPHLIPHNHELGVCGGLRGLGRFGKFSCSYFLSAYVCKKPVEVAYAIGSLGNITLPAPQPNMIRTKTTLFEQLRPRQLRHFIHQNTFIAGDHVTKDTDCAIQCFSQTDCVGFTVKCISKTKCRLFACSLLSYTTRLPLYSGL